MERNFKHAAKMKNVLPRLKVALLRGQKVSTLDGLKRWGTMRLAEYVRVLRGAPHFLDIDTTMVLNKRTGKRYGVYSYGNKK